MASVELEKHVSDVETLSKNISNVVIDDQPGNVNGPSSQNQVINDDENGVQITCFTEVMNDVSFHIQIMRLKKQIYAWIGCSSAKFGHLYAAAPTRPTNTVSVASILGGSSDNIGSSIARRLALRTGLNIVLACNIPKENPMLEADAERTLIQKIMSLGYMKPKSQGSPSMEEKMALLTYLTKVLVTGSLHLVGDVLKLLKK